MDLDLQPVADLDLQPAAEQPKAIDLQRVTELKPGTPESVLSKAKRATREKLSNLIGPSPEQLMRDSIVDASGNLVYKPLGSAVDQEGFFPALSHPMMPLPRVPDLPDVQLPGMINPATAGAVINTAEGFAEFMESPLGVATAGVGGLGVNVLKRLMGGAYAADIARHVPEVARAAGEKSVTGSPQEQQEAYLGLGSTVILPGVLTGEAVPLKTKAAPTAPVVPRLKSEFGADLPPPSGQGGLEKTPVKPNGEAVSTPTVPETAQTLESQVDWLKQGKRNAVLVTPEAPMVEVPEGMATRETPAGTFIFNPAKLKPEEIDQAVTDNTVGRLLGYGIDARPIAGTESGVVVVRGPEGTEKQAVVTDAANQDKALTAAAAAAGPGDAVSVEDGGQVLADRRTGASAIAVKTLREAVAAREPVPAKWIEDYNAAAATPWALPEGYGRKGDAFVYKEPERKLTPEQLAARESAAAMADLRAARVKADEVTDPDWSVPLPKERKAEEGVPGMPAGQAPDILDWIGDNFPRGVRISSREDFGDYAREAKGRSKELMGVERGEPADQVLKEMHAQGWYRRIETEDDLLTAMNRAAQSRMGARRSGLISGSRAEAWADEVLTGGATHAGPDVLAAYLVKGAAVLERMAVKTYEAFHEAFTKLYPEAAGRAREIYDQAKELVAKGEQGIVNPLAGDVSQHEKVTELAGLAKETQPVVDRAVERIRNELGLVARSSLKEEEKILAKANRPSIKSERPWFDVEHVRDALRFKAQLERFEDAEGIHRILEQEGFQLVKLDARKMLEPKEWGWRFVAMDLRAPNGMLVEFYAPVKELDQPGVKKPNHVLFEKWRQRDMAKLTPAEQAEWRRDLLESNQRYQAAWESALSRLGLDANAASASWTSVAARLESRSGSKSFMHSSAVGTAEPLNTQVPSFLRRPIEESGSEGGQTTTSPLSGFQETPESRVDIPNKDTRGAAKGKGERATGVKVAASQAVSDPVKQAITAYLYDRRTNGDDEALAAGLVKDLGLQAAMKALRDRPEGLHGATWSKLLGQVTRTLAEQERQARTAGDTAAAQRLAETQAQVWNDALPNVTELAQSLQALNDIVDMSPDAQVIRLQKELEREGKEQLDQHRPELEQIRTALDQGKKDGLDEVRHDPAVNEAARGAVDEAVANQEDVKRAVVMEMAEPWASSPAIMRLAREQVQSKANELLNKSPRPAGLTAPQVLRQIMDDLAKRAAGIFAGHLQGAEPNVAIVDKLMQRLGITRDKAVSLANALNKEWEQQLKAARAKLPKRIASMRVTAERATGATLESTTAQVDAAIRRALADWNQKLGDVLKQEVGRQDATGQHIAERVVQTSGLTGENADTLRNVFSNRWNALVTDAQRRALEAMEKRSGVTTTRPLKDAFQKLVEMERLGALTSERFFETVKKALKLKQLTQADAATLRSLVRRAQEHPEGYLRQLAAAEVLKFTEKLKGNVSWKDVPMAIFYANVLSGFTTPAKIVIENVNLLASSTVAALLSRPKDLLHPAEWLQTVVGAYKRGVAKGALQAAGTLKTGTVTGLWETPRTNVLEMKPFGERMEWLNFWKYFGRVIGTSHELTFKPSWEIKQAMLARDVARREGLNGSRLAQRVADLLANTPAEVQKARGQALSELQSLGTLNKLDLARRTREILEQRREELMPGSTAIARDYALRTSYLNEPYGFLGFIATAVRGSLEKARKQFPISGTVAKTQVPFTTVIANILNEKLNWSPWGLARAAWSHKTGELYGRPMLDAGERSEIYAKAIVGTIAITSLATLFGEHIHGNGPSDPKKRKQLQAAGWIPHSIELNGRYYSYMNTPAGVGLSLVGNVLDWHRYGKGDEADSVTRLAFAGKATLNAIVSQGMLDSLKRIFEALGSESTTEGADKLQKLTARTASSFIVPNLVQQVDRIFDPTVYDKTGVAALIGGQIPFVRRNGKPSLTVLGDPVEVDPFHYWTSTASKDLLLQTLAGKQAWVPEPSKTQIIGDRKRGPDYFRAMTPDEYYDWILISGKAIRARLEENVDRIALAEPDQARKLVQDIANDEHAKVKEMFK